MQYMLLIYAEERTEQPSEAEQKEVFTKWMAYTEAMKEAGVLVAGDALQPTKTAKSLRMRSGERLVTDGPFAETKEHLGGYYLLDCESEQVALDWAAKCPAADYGTIEVRALVFFD